MAFIRQIISRASLDRLELLIDERLKPGTDKARIDQRIWNLFGEKWAVLYTDLAGFSRNVAEFGIIHFLQTIHESHRLLVPVIQHGSGVLLKTEGEPFPVIPSRPSLLVRFDSVISDLLGNLIDMTAKLNQVLDDDTQTNFRKTLAHLETITFSLSKHSHRFGAIIADAEATVKNAHEASNALPSLMADVSQSTQSLAEMADQLRAAGETISQTALTLQQTARTSGGDVQRFTGTTLPDVSAMTQDLRDAAEHLRRVSESLERDPSVLVYGRPAPKRGPGE